MSEPVVAVDPTPPPPLARDEVTAFVDRWSVLLRSAAGLGIAAVGLLTRAPSAGSVVLLGLGGWSLLRLLGRVRASPGLLLRADAGVVLAVALATPLLCTAEEARSFSGVAAAELAAASVTLVWQLRGFRPVVWCVLAMVAAAVGGELTPGVRADEVVVVYFLPVQSVVVWVLMAVLRRGAVQVDDEALALVDTRWGSGLAAARRAAEREHWAILHDTAAATLLMVGGGVPDGAAERVRKQARRDLDALTQDPGDARLRTPTPDGDQVLLGPVLRGVTTGVGLRTTLSDPGRRAVPVLVGIALRDATRELLTNVERHAGVGWASIEVGGSTAGGVWVEVRDDGTGIGPDVAEGRGLRESVRGRMDRVGGSVVVHPGTGRGAGPGTRVRLQWPAGSA